MDQPSRRAPFLSFSGGITAGFLRAPASFFYLLRRPALWPFSILPALVTVGLVGLGIIVGYTLGPTIATRLVGYPTPWSSIPRIGVHLAAVLAGAFVGLGLALLLTAPLQELLSQKVEKSMRGGTRTDPGRGIRWDVAQAVRGAQYFLMRAPFVLLLGLIPFAGPPLALLWAAHSLALQQTDATLARHGLDFQERRDWHRKHRFESIGFGLGGLATLLIPVANLLLMPILVVGATRFALARMPEGAQITNKSGGSISGAQGGV